MVFGCCIFDMMFVVQLFGHLSSATIAHESVETTPQTVSQNTGLRLK